MVRAVILDCLDVLMNDPLVRIVAELRETEPEKAERIVQTVMAASKGEIDPSASRATVAELLGVTLEGYGDRMRQSEVRNQQLLNYIMTLRPTYKVGVLSNMISGGLEARFPADEAAKYFDVMVTSGDIGHAKPDVRAYEIAAEKLGVKPSECIFVDDKESYCQGAREAGMMAIRYQSFEQTKQELAAKLRES